MKWQKKSSEDLQEMFKIQNWLDSFYSNFLISFNSFNLNLKFKVEYDLSEYEKRKIAEEKQRLAMTKYETNILLIIYLQSITLSLKKK